MRRPGPKVSIQTVQDRRSRGTKNPWVARWKVGHRNHTKSFPTRAAAESFQARLRIAHEDGERFDAQTGRPESWHDTATTVAEFAVEWFRGEWPTLAPRSRKSIAEALERALPRFVSPKAPAPPESLRDDLRAALQAEAPVLPQYLARWSLTLAEVDRSVCVEVNKALGQKLDGSAAASSTAGRHRKNTRAMLDAAVDAAHIPVSPWPAARRGVSQRKAAKKASPMTAIDVRALPTPAQARAAIGHLRTHQPRSADYELTAACVYFAGMRPSEPRALGIEDHLVLPDEGWGVAWVHEADQRAGEKWTEEGEEVGLTKTATRRRVPLCPELVAMLRAHIGDRTSGPVIARSSYSNLTRAWHRARAKAGGEWVLYDLRHLHASLAVSKGANLAEVAERLGHSVETLVRVYAHALPGDAEQVNSLLESAL